MELENYYELIYNTDYTILHTENNYLSGIEGFQEAFMEKQMLSCFSFVFLFSVSVLATPHVFWYNAYTNGYTLSDTTGYGPNIPANAMIHQGKIVTCAQSVSPATSGPGFAIGCGLADSEGRCGAVYVKDLKNLTTPVLSAVVRGEYRDGWVDNAFCNFGVINIRIGIVDISQGIAMWGGPDMLPDDAVWGDLNPGKSLDFSLPLIGPVKTVQFQAQHGRLTATGPSYLDGRFFEIDVRDQVNYVISRRTDGREYAIVFLTAPGQGSLGKVICYAAEECQMPVPGSDKPWTKDGNTMHLLVEAADSPTNPRLTDASYTTALKQLRLNFDVVVRYNQVNQNAIQLSTDYGAMIVRLNSSCSVSETANNNTMNIILSDTLAAQLEGLPNVSTNLTIALDQGAFVSLDSLGSNAVAFSTGFPVHYETADTTLPTVPPVYMGPQTLLMSSLANVAWSIIEKVPGTDTVAFIGTYAAQQNLTIPFSFSYYNPACLCTNTGTGFLVIANGDSFVVMCDGLDNNKVWMYNSCVVVEKFQSSTGSSYCQGAFTAYAEWDPANVGVRIRATCLPAFDVTLVDFFLLDSATWVTTHLASTSAEGSFTGIVHQGSQRDNAYSYKIIVYGAMNAVAVADTQIVPYYPSQTDTSGSTQPNANTWYDDSVNAVRLELFNLPQYDSIQIFRYGATHVATIGINWFYDNAPGKFDTISYSFVVFEMDTIVASFWGSYVPYASSTQGAVVVDIPYPLQQDRVVRPSETRVEASAMRINNNTETAISTPGWWAHCNGSAGFHSAIVQVSAWIDSGTSLGRWDAGDRKIFSGVPRFMGDTLLWIYFPAQQIVPHSSVSIIYTIDLAASLPSGFSMELFYDSLIALPSQPVYMDLYGRDHVTLHDSIWQPSQPPMSLSGGYTDNLGTMTSTSQYDSVPGIYVSYYIDMTRFPNPASLEFSSSFEGSQYHLDTALTGNVPQAGYYFKAGDTIQPGNYSIKARLYSSDTTVMPYETYYSVRVGNTNPFFVAWYDTGVKAIQVEWGNINQTNMVSQYFILRDNSPVNNAPASSMRYTDWGANYNMSHSYQLVAIYVDSGYTGADTFQTMYYPPFSEPGLFCGDPALITQALDQKRQLAWHGDSGSLNVVPYDPAAGPVVTERDIGGLGHIISLVMGTDTLAALSPDKMACDQPWISEWTAWGNLVMFANLRYWWRPYIHAWQDSGNAIRITWGDFDTSKVASYILQRDDIEIARYTSSISTHFDSSTNPTVYHQYRLIAAFSDGGETMIYADYSPSGPGPDNGEMAKDRYMVWANHFYDLSTWTHDTSDTRKPGIVFNYFLHPDSLADLSATKSALLSVYLRNTEQAAFPSQPVFTKTIVNPDSMRGAYLYRLAQDSVAGHYEVRAILRFGARVDTSCDQFDLGHVLRVTFGQKLTVDISLFAKKLLHLSAAPAVSSLVAADAGKGVVTGTLYAYTVDKRSVNDEQVRVSYMANGVAVNFAISIGNPFFSGGLLQAGIRPDSGFYSGDGRAALDIGGRAFESNSYTSSDTGFVREYVYFDTISVWSTGRPVMKLPAQLRDSISYNTGSVTGIKSITVKAWDPLFGVSVEGPAGKLYHLAAGVKTVRGQSGATYATVTHALKAGEKTLFLDPSYPGMPIMYKDAPNISITGQITDTDKTVINGEGFDACMVFENSASIALTGLAFKNGAAFNAGFNTCSNVQVARCRFIGGLFGLFAMSEERHDSMGWSTAMPVQNFTVTNSIFENLEGLGVYIEMPSKCRFANNTFVNSWGGLVFGIQRGLVSLSDTNYIINNLFSNLPNGGYGTAKKGTTDKLTVSVKNNLFSDCDSGNVIVLLAGENSSILTFLRDTLPATNISATVSLFETGSFPYLPLSTGPARNAGLYSSTLVPAYDFRGFPRTSTAGGDNRIDIGAIEYILLEPGVNIVSQAVDAGYCKISYKVIKPDASGTMAQATVSVKKNGVAYSPVHLRNSATQGLLELYPLPDGAYSTIFSAVYTATGITKTFTKTADFSIGGGTSSLVPETWYMVGYADSQSQIQKNASRLAGLNDSTLYIWDIGQGKYMGGSGADTMRLNRGRAYWNLTSSPVTISVNPIFYTSTDTAAFLLPIAAGWNMITSPFPFPVAINRSGLLHFADLAGSGGYVTGTALKPLAGCWYYSAAADTLRMAYAPQVSVVAAKVAGKALYRNAFDWDLSVSARMGKYQDNDNMAGVRPASAGPIADYPEPPQPLGGISVYFEDQNAQYGPRLMRSFREPGNGTVLWTLVVDPAGKAGDIEVLVDGVANFSETQFVFCGSLSAGFQDLKKDPVVRMSTKGGKQWATLVATSDPEFMDNLNRGFELAQNTPNPFNPTTAISFFVPYTWDNGKTLLAAKRRVELSVYDVRGQRIALLADQAFKAGALHYVVWRAADCASGVYFYRIVSGDFTQTRKMVLVR